MLRFTVPSVLGLLLAGAVTAAGTKWDAYWGPEPPVAPFGRAPLPRKWTRVAMIFPLIGACKVAHDYNANRGRYRHTGVDIQAPMMTPIVAPFSGTIGLKRDTFWIYGDNGWACLGTHLNDDSPGKRDHKANRDLMFAPDIQPAQHVEAGQFIGYVGMSGNATGPHLHFELYAPGKGPIGKRIRNPLPSLVAATKLRTPKVFITRLDERPSAGVVRLDGCIRYADPGKKELMILLIKTWHSGEPPGRVTTPRYVAFKVPDALLTDCGGWQIFNQIPETQPISVFAPDRPKLDGETLERVHLVNR